jgi:hypothetical protein
MEHNNNYHNCGKQGEYNDTPKFHNVRNEWFIRADEDEYCSVSDIKYCPFCGEKL